MTKDWYCQTCRQSYNHRGVARHRAMHRDKREQVTFTTRTHIIEYDYREENGNG